MNRFLVLLPLVLVVQGVLGACNDSDDTGGKVEAKRWSVDGLSFENPHGYKKLDVDDVADAASGAEGIEDLSDDMGIPEDALVNLMRQFDLYLVGEVSAPGFVDNVGVAEQAGAVPTEAELTSQFESIGAQLLDYEKVDTDLGEVVTGLYSLDAGDKHIEGETIVVDVDGPVFITITSSERDVTDEVAEGILDTLDED